MSTSKDIIQYYQSKKRKILDTIKSNHTNTTTTTNVAHSKCCGTEIGKFHSVSLTDTSVICDTCNPLFQKYVKKCAREMKALSEFYNNKPCHKCTKNLTRYEIDRNICDHCKKPSSLCERCSVSLYTEFKPSYCASCTELDAKGEFNKIVTCDRCKATIMNDSEMRSFKCEHDICARDNVLFILCQKCIDVDQYHNKKGTSLCSKKQFFGNK